MIYDDDFGFFEDFRLLPNYADIVIPKFIKHERLLFFSVVLQLFIEAYFIAVGYIFREDIYEEVNIAF